jgi:hypothetical protein
MPLFSRLFSYEGNIEYTGCRSTEKRGLKVRVFEERWGRWEHVLHCDGSLKGLAIPSV